jgi:hypothetical protein
MLTLLGIAAILWGGFLLWQERRHDQVTALLSLLDRLIGALEAKAQALPGDAAAEREDSAPVPPADAGGGEPSGGFLATVRALAEAGASVEDISRSTGRPRGEVELALHLLAARRTR